MEISAALLLTIFLAATTVTDGVTPTHIVSISTTEFVRNEANTTTTESVNEVNTTTKSKFFGYARPFSSIRDILMQEIHTLNKDVSDAKVSI